MREWKKPEVKIFDVKMDENIAASGENNYEVKFLELLRGMAVVSGEGNYNCSPDGTIQDTSVKYVDGMYVDDQYTTTISGCRV